MKNLTTKRFNLLDNAIILFGASWCGGCKVQKTILDRYTDAEYPIYYYDIDQESSLQPILGIQSLPTLIILKGGKEYKRNVGIIQLDKIKELIK